MQGGQRVFGGRLSVQWRYGRESASLSAHGQRATAATAAWRRRRPSATPSAKAGCHAGGCGAAARSACGVWGGWPTGRAWAHQGDASAVCGATAPSGLSDLGRRSDSAFPQGGSAALEPPS